MTLNDYFDRIFCINLPRRTDRRALAQAELDASGIDPAKLEWADGFDYPIHAHAGCTTSHRNLIRRVASGQWQRVLILEDDFKVLTLDDLAENKFLPHYAVHKTHCSVLDGRGNLNERFSALIPFLPETWDVLYLAAGYGEPPISRLNKHVIRCGYMQTTSTYGITRDFARVWTEKTDAWADRHPPGPFGHPIDNVFGAYAHDHLYYVLQPRLAFQRGTKSDITGETNSYLNSMTDPAHESMI